MIARELTPIDIGDAPDILRLAEEVHRTGQPRLLRKDDEDLAVFSPAPAVKRHARKPRVYTQADDEAFLASAGSWKDFDLEQFFKDNGESRRSSRPVPEL